MWRHPYASDELNVNKSEQFQLMKVITPAYPAQNSTFNVTHSTLHVLKGEFKKGLEMCQKVLNGQVKWEALWVGPGSTCSKYPMQFWGLFT